MLVVTLPGLCLCRDQAPWQARAATFAPVVSALGSCMAIRYSCPAEPLWRTAAEAFNSVRSTNLMLLINIYKMLNSHGAVILHLALSSRE